MNFEYRSTNNKNLETDIGVWPEHQKSKAATSTNFYYYQIFKRWPFLHESSDSTLAAEYFLPQPFPERIPPPDPPNFVSLFLNSSRAWARQVFLDVWLPLECGWATGGCTLRGNWLSPGMGFPLSMLEFGQAQTYTALVHALRIALSLYVQLPCCVQKMFPCNQ